MVYGIRRLGASLGILLVYAGTIGTTAGLSAQGLGGAGTIQGLVKDPTGGVMQAVEVKIANPVTGFTRTVTTDAAGTLRLQQPAAEPVSPDRRGAGLQPLERDVDVRTAVPITLDLTLALAGDHQFGRRRRSRRGSAGARSERAHRRRPEPDRETAARVVGRA